MMGNTIERPASKWRTSRRARALIAMVEAKDLITRLVAAAKPAIDSCSVPYRRPNGTRTTFAVRIETVDYDDQGMPIRRQSYLINGREVGADSWASFAVLDHEELEAIRDAINHKRGESPVMIS